jgi:uncharacterized Zn-binding protein involved in type VI secretion
MPNTARLSDTISHGGFIIGASPDRQANGLGVARIGDNAMCNQHGLVTIVGGSAGVQTNGLATARIGDMLSCGAVIVAGSPDTDTGDTGPSVGAVPGPVVTYPAPDGGAPLTYTEADLGPEYDDPPSNSAGLSIYPPVRDRAPTAAELARNTALVGSDPAPTPVSTETTAAPPPASHPVDISGITSPVPDSLQLSQNFTVADLSTKALCAHQLQAQHGLTDVQIAANMKALCMNILEPFAAKFGRTNMVINSGFRPTGSSVVASGYSQHESGSAADIRFVDQNRGTISTDVWWERVMWVKDNLPFDQMIVEYIHNKPWIHLSFAPTLRRQLLTAVLNGGRVTYPHGLQKLV